MGALSALASSIIHEVGALRSLIHILLILFRILIGQSRIIAIGVLAPSYRCLFDLVPCLIILLLLSLLVDHDLLD